MHQNAPTRREPPQSGRAGACCSLSQNKGRRHALLTRVAGPLLCWNVTSQVSLRRQVSDPGVASGGGCRSPDTHNGAHSAPAVTSQPPSVPGTVHVNVQASPLCSAPEPSAQPQETQPRAPSSLALEAPGESRAGGRADTTHPS